MIASFFGKKTLVLSDNAGLARAIALILNQCGIITETVVQHSAAANQKQISRVDTDLIIVALSNPYSEPALALRLLPAKKPHAKQTPILVISDKTQVAHADTSINHLDLSFEFNELCNKVMRILTDTKPVKVSRQPVTMLDGRSFR